MENFHKFLLDIDSFGKNINIYYKKQPMYKTQIGGIITIFVWGFCAVLCYFFGSQLINKQNPQVITSEQYVQQPKRINISNDNLIFMFGLNNINSTFFLDPTLFQFRAVQLVKQNLINNQTGEPVINLVPYNLTMKVCDMKDVGIPATYDYFNNLDVSLLYCFTQGQDIYMEGDYDSENFAQVYVYIEKCQNGTSTTVCKPKEIINEQLSQTYLSFYLTNVLVNPNNYQDPFQHKGMNLYTSTSSSFPKEFQVYFTNQYLQDDDGILFSDIVEHHSFVFTNYQETTFFGDEETLVRILLRLQKQKENLTQRRYQKIQDIIPQIIGLLKLFTFGLSLLVNPIVNLQMYQDLGENLFEHDQMKQIPKNNTEEVLKKIKSKQKLSQKQQTTFYEYDDKNLENEKEIVNFQMSPVIQQNQLSKNNKKMNNNLEFFQSYSSKYNQKGQLLQQNFEDQCESLSPIFQLKSNQEYDKNNNQMQYQMSPSTSQKQLTINSNRLAIQSEFQQFRNRYQIKKSFCEQDFDDLPKRPLFSPKAKFKKHVDSYNFNLYSPPLSIKQQSSKIQENMYSQLNIFNAENQQNQINNIQTKLSDVEIIELAEENQQEITTVNTNIKKQQKCNQKKKKLSFSIFDYLKLVFCKKKFINPNVGKMKYGIKSIQKQLDVIYIISKLQEIDKLKSVIFSEDQVKLFNNISKPIISFKQKNAKHFNEKCVQKQNEEVTPAMINSIYQFTKEYKQKSFIKTDEQKSKNENLQAIYNLLEKQNISQIDKRLIELNQENLNINKILNQTQ